LASLVSVCQVQTETELTKTIEAELILQEVNRVSRFDAVGSWFAAAAAALAIHAEGRNRSMMCLVKNCAPNS